MASTEVAQQLVVTVMTDVGFNYSVLFDSKHPMERLKGAPSKHVAYENKRGKATALYVAAFGVG
eukprot:651387-Pyramimonas_sp.AAC.2